MSTIKYKELRKRYELDGAENTVRHLSEAIEKKELKCEDFSIRELAESLIPNGHYFVREIDPRNNNGTIMLESEGIDATAFLNVTGQIIYNKILETYRHETFVMSQLVETIPTRLDGEIIPGTSGISDRGTEVKDGMPYPNVGFSEDYIETPATNKHGLIVPITKEAIYFDRTHTILTRAAEVGEVLAVNKEKRILDVVLGVTNTFKWNGKKYNTYCSATSDPYVNSLANNALADWSNLDQAEAILANIVDPYTNDPVLVEPDTVLIMPQKRGVAHRLFNASEVSCSPAEFSSLSAIPNPYYRYNVVSSRLAYRRLVQSGVTEANAAQYWFLGNFRKAFAYMENWPLSVSQSGIGSEAEFNRDILVRFKASERGTPAVINPRYVVKCTG